MYPLHLLLAWRPRGSSKSHKKNYNENESKKARWPWKQTSFLFTLPLPDLTGNSPYCLSYNSYDVSSESLILDPLIILYLTFLFILITCLLYVVLILWGEMLSWSTGNQTLDVFLVHPVLLVIPWPCSHFPMSDQKYWG